ncbi:hypothetical protein ONS96_005282 [Cadophora gregata f. sp. sojae]|nr:hypothetical protein ONS96_005282 [Cadophora gregata f. sp. sojae]
MAQTSRKVTASMLLRELKWGLNDAERLHHFILSDRGILSAWKEFTSDANLVSRGPNGNTVIEKSTALLQATLTSQYVHLGSADKQAGMWQIEDHYTRFVVQVVDCQRRRGGIWDTRSLAEVEQMCSISLMILRYIRSNQDVQKLMGKPLTGRVPNHLREMTADYEEEDRGDKRHLMTFFWKEQDGKLVAISPGGPITSDTGVTTYALPSDSQERADAIKAALRKSTSAQKAAYNLLLQMATLTGPLGTDLSHRQRFPLPQAGADEDNLNNAINHIVQNIANSSPQNNQNGGEDNGDSDDRLLQAIGPLLQISKREIQDFEKLMKYMDGHSKGPSYPEACKKVGVVSQRAPNIPCTSFRVTLYPYQVIGTAWLLDMWRGPLQAGILADDMGLGKTIQSLSVLAVVRNELQARSNPAASTTERCAWKNGCTLIVVPLASIHQWEQDIRQYLTYANTIIYDSTYKEILTRDKVETLTCESIILTTAELLNRRHGRNAIEKWATEQRRRNRASDSNSCPFCLDGIIPYGIFDEAHMLKNVQSQIWQALKALDIPFKILLSGTPMSNKPSDLVGIAGLMEHKRVWENLGVDSNRCNPFSFEHTHPQSILRCTQTAMERMAKETDVPRQASMIRMFYQKTLLKRTYATVVEGTKIGEHIPPHRTTTIHLRIQPDQEERLKAVMSKNRKTLYSYGPANVGVIMKADSARKLAHCTTFLGFDDFTWDAKKCDGFRKSGKTLHHLMIAIHSATSTEKLGFNPNMINPQDKEALLKAVAIQSPKLRYLSYLVAQVVIILKTKAVIWQEYPWVQLLVEKYFEYSGIAVGSLHSAQNTKTRRAIQSEFNFTDKPSLLVCNYRCSSVAINLQFNCHINILVEPAVSIQQQLQAIFRIRRLGQTKEQQTIILWQDGTYNDHQFAKQQHKGLSDVMAQVNEDGDIQFIADVTDPEQRKEQCQLLWKVLNGDAGDIQLFR